MEDSHMDKAKELLDALLPMINDYFTLADGWESLGTSEGVTGSRILHPNGLQIVKVTALLPKSVSEVLAYYWDLSNKPKYEHKLRECRCVKDFSENFRLVYSQFALHWPISNRDFVVAQRWSEKDDGIVIYSKTIDGALSETYGVIRGEIFFEAQYLKRNGFSTEITTLYCTDLKGNLPRVAINKIANRQIGKFGVIKKDLK